MQYTVHVNCTVQWTVQLTWTVTEKHVALAQESVFRELKTENTFLMLNLTFSFDWNYISFDSLSMYCQTWESEENGFQESEFLETNKALVVKGKDSTV